MADITFVKKQDKTRKKVRMLAFFRTWPLPLSSSKRNYLRFRIPREIGQFLSPKFVGMVWRWPLSVPTWLKPGFTKTWRNRVCNEGLEWSAQCFWLQENSISTTLSYLNNMFSCLSYFEKWRVSWPSVWYPQMIIKIIIEKFLNSEG